MAGRRSPHSRIGPEDYGDYDPYSQADEPSVQLHEYLVAQPGHLLTLEATLPGVRNLGDVLEYEFLIASEALVELEPALAGEEAYELKAQELLDTIQSTNLERQPDLRSRPFQLATHQATLTDLVESLATLGEEDNENLYLALGTLVNETLDSLEHELADSLLAVSYLRLFTRLSVYVDLLKTEGMGVVIQEPVAVLLEEAAELL
jgi:hypothetical protein